MNTRKIIRVGILFSIAIVVILWGLNYMKGRNLFRTETVYFATYDRIGGLVESSPVTINGFQIGQVQNIELLNNDPESIIVKMIITYPGIEVPLGTVAKIYSTDIMGTKGIAFEMTRDSLLYEYGDTLSGGIEGDLRDQVNAQVLPLKLKAESLMASMDSILASFQLVLNETSRNSLIEGFSGANRIIQNLDNTTLFLDDYVKTEAIKVSLLLSTIDSISSNLKGDVEEVRYFITNLRQISDTLSGAPIIEAVHSFNLVLSDLHLLVDQINRGEGSLGQLVNSDSLYNVLMASSQNLNRLIQDLRINPKRYVHFSLIDRGQTIVPTSDPELVGALNQQASLSYYVCVLESSTPLAPDHPDLKHLKNLEFIQVGNLYHYFVLNHKNFDKCQRKAAQLKKDFPKVGVFTWVNGVWTRINL